MCYVLYMTAPEKWHQGCPLISIDRHTHMCSDTHIRTHSHTEFAIVTSCRSSLNRNKLFKLKTESYNHETFLCKFYDQKHKKKEPSTVLTDTSRALKTKKQTIPSSLAHSAPDRARDNRPWNNGVKCTPIFISEMSEVSFLWKQYPEWCNADSKRQTFSYTRMLAFKLLLCVRYLVMGPEGRKKISPSKENRIQC